mmetsp:Transcript_17719/g.21496  ORF Transcript_17719/g.21496 Transcript_17719/m.21496 type:complete len:425 (+) Transcript_17719:424-1698(+)
MAGKADVNLEPKDSSSQASEGGAVIDSFMQHDVEETRIREGRIAIANFLRKSTCYDIIPESSKVAVFDQSIPLRLAYYALVELDAEVHKVSGAAASRGDAHAVPVWDPLRQCLAGIITVLDILHVLKYGHKTDSIKEIMDEHSIASWWSLVAQLRRNPALVTSLAQANVPAVQAAALQAKDQSQNYKQYADSEEERAISLGADSTLYEACMMLQTNRIRWIPMIDKDSHTCLGVLTHLEVLRYLVSEFREERQLFNQPIKSLGIGTFAFNGAKIVSARADTLLCDVIDLLIENHVSCVPIVDSSDKPITIYSPSNITTPTAKSSIDMCMTLPVSYFLNISGSGEDSGSSDSDATPTNNVHHSNTDTEWTAQLFTCSCDESLQDIFVKFAETQVHRLVSVDANGSIDGIVSLSDLLFYFLEQQDE